VVFDFDGVFTDNTVYIFEDGRESVVCNRADGIGIEILRKLKIPMKIISTEQNSVVIERAKKLNLSVINNVSNKRNELEKFSKLVGVGVEYIAFVGNDINDEECMKNVGFPIAVNDAVEKIKMISKHVLSKNGGKGAVREFCELVSSSYAK
jgi:3-deoxy-D-manno-octulosonate 8-phosphate phosphatase (KDO 8-P phosphatase)